MVEFSFPNQYVGKSGSIFLAHEVKPPLISTKVTASSFNFSFNVLTAICESFPRLQTNTTGIFGSSLLVLVKVDTFSLICSTDSDLCKSLTGTSKNVLRKECRLSTNFIFSKGVCVGGGPLCLSYVLPSHFFLWEHSGSVVECLTQERGAAGLSLTGLTALCP